MVLDVVALLSALTLSKFIINRIAQFHSRILLPTALVDGERSHEPLERLAGQHASESGDHPRCVRSARPPDR